MSRLGDNEVRILPDLVPEFRQALEQARMIFNEPDKSGGFFFFFWVANLAAPGNSFKLEEI